MPSFTNQIANMVQVGPIVEIAVGPSVLYMQTMTKKGKTIPEPVKAVAMIDTGASGTGVTPGLVQQLGLAPVGTSKMSTPSTVAAVEAAVYNLGLAFPNGVSIPSVMALEAPLGGQHIQCLIGRDVLQHCVLNYVGYINQYTLSF
jgi:hypothetical protein